MDPKLQELLRAENALERAEHLLFSGEATEQEYEAAENAVVKARAAWLRTK